MTASGTSPLFSHRLVVGAVLVLGIAGAIISYREGRASEEERAVAEFANRASVRHALTREILGHYEDALFGLSAAFMVDPNVTREEFAHAAGRLGERLTGAQAFEWVPLVRPEERAAIEADLKQVTRAPHAGLIEFDGQGRPHRAPPRPYHYPIFYIHPLAGNEVALGYDLVAGPTQAVLDRARETRRMMLSPQVRLVQEKSDKFGVVMIWPVFRATASGAADGGGEVFTGFLQCVFRVHDLLETAHARQPDTILDMLFLDMSETDRSKRILFYRPSQRSAADQRMTEEAFRRGVTREFKLPFGHRDWRVVFRPRPGWIESRAASAPIVRSAGVLLLSALVAGLVQLIGRRTETIRREVDERTVELAESRRQLANMLHALPGMAYRCTYDDQLTVLFLSEGALALTGWTAEEFINGVAHFRDCIHPDDLGRVREATRVALQEQKDIELEYRIRTKTGDEKWVLSRGRGVYTAGGELSIFEGLAIDITAQKNAEAARLELERKLLEGQKLESLGLLAGGIAHDFNNLLSSILGNASIARLALPAGNAGDPQLRAIEAASLRAAELCRQMLAYAGKGRFVIEPTDLTVLTEDLLPLLKISIAHQATLTLNLARNLPAVLADATQLRQIVMNLVLNAADAIASAGRTKPGEVMLTTGVMHADQVLLQSCVAGSGLPRGDYVFLEVRDNGTGMTPEVVAKIFDPFFTTKFAGRGLGLAAVLGIVRGHHGALRVQSAPGRGSSFRLLLPPAKKVAAPAKPVEAGAPARWKRAGSVLVVEDEDHVRFVLVEMLKTFGFTPTSVADGPAAVAVFREKPAHFDLVMLDLLMPGMNGEQTLEALRGLQPDVRVLLVSGYAEGNVLGRLGGGRALAFLAKPFTREALERKLRELLG